MHPLKPKHIILILFFLLFAFHSCKTKKVVETPAVEEVKPQADTTLIPSFPSEVLYVVSREYESVWDSTTDKYSTIEAEYIRENNVSIKEYMEKRLISLFPDLAYIGLMEKNRGESQRFNSRIDKKNSFF